MTRIASLQPSRVLADLGLLDWPAIAIGLEKEFMSEGEVVERALAEAGHVP